MLARILSRTAERFGDKPALVTDTRTLSYAELNCALTGTMHVRTERDVIVTALPAPHVYGNVVINSIFMAGGTVVLMERFDPEGVLERIARHRATINIVAPSVLRSS
jgi:acyl-CoA synthetase (AMP-forming)/AMP-acid ligase II